MEQPYGVDTDSMELSIQSIEEEEKARKQAERDANMAAAKAVTEQEGTKPEPSNPLQARVAEKDAKDPKDFNTTDNVIEAVDTVAKGAVEGAESIVTLPERLYDSVTGEKGGKDDPSQPDYKPDWNPFAGVPRPETNTTWGGIVQEISKAATIEAVAVTAKVPGSRNLLGAAAIEGIVDQDSMKRDPLTKQLLHSIPGFQDVFGDADHPLVKMAGNTLEIMGFAKLGGYLINKLGDTFNAARRAKSIDDQIVKKGRQEFDDARALEAEVVPVKVADITDQKALPSTEMRNGTFRGHKNKPIADSWQGSPAATNSAFDVMSDSARVYDNSGYGSTDGYTTAAQAERMAQQNGMDPKYLRDTAKELLGDDRFNAMMADAKANNKTFEEVFGYAFDRMREVTGRNTGRMSTEDFWKPIMDDVSFRTGGKESMEAWSMENVVAADLVNAELFSQIRDAAVASRELLDVADVMDVDGPMKVLTDRLIVGLTNVKRSRYLISSEFRKLQGPKAARASREATEQIGEEVKAQVGMMVDMINQDATDDTLKAFLELMSSSNKVQTYEDLSAYMKKKIGAWGVTGEEPAGAVIRELQGVYTNSILSGPKTAGRAMQGTFTASLMRPLSQMVGGVAKGDFNTARANMAAVQGFFEAIPESFTLFKSKLSGYWSGDLATIQTRFSDYTKKQQDWDLMGHWINTSPDASLGDKAAYAIANVARTINNSSFVNYTTRLMAATDDSFTAIMARSRAKEKAMRKAMDDLKVGDVTEITDELLEKYQDNFYADLLDDAGNIDINKDTFLKSTVKEATLTTDISGFGKSLESIMNSYPFTKPFFLFARTGINGINLSYKVTPGLGMLHKQSFDVLTASSDDLSRVMKYGIETAADLDNAKALILGRQAIGAGVTFMGAMAYMSGNLTGNGPDDRRMLNMWRSTGWQPRSIKIGGQWVSYDAFEPFNIVLSAIADVGDNQKLMGEEWAENQLAKIAMILGQNAISKSYTDGLQQFVDLLNLKEGSAQRTIANLINNTVPFGGLRNEIGKVINPYMKELDSSIQESIRNRNLTSELVAGDPLPTKFDILTGEPLKDWNFFERMFNATSPIGMSTDRTTPGRTLLMNSNFDLTIAGYSAPDGTSLEDSPQVRSMYQEAIGKQNIEAQLDALAGRKDVQDSVQDMVEDAKAGRRNMDPMKTYVHNDLIRNIFTKAQRKAWAKIKDRPEVQALIQEQLDADLQQQSRKKEGQKNSIETFLQQVPTR